MTGLPITSDSLFDTVAESVGLIVMVWDIQRDRIHVSDQWQTLTGAAQRQPEMSSAEFHATIHHDDLMAFDAAIARCLKGAEKFYDAEIRVWRQPGSWQWLAVRGRVVERDPSGRATSLVATFTDAGDRKHAEQVLAESEQRFQSVYETSMHGILVGTPEGAVLSANPAACRITGYTENELIHLGRAGLCDPTDERVAASVQMRGENGSYSGEITLIRKDGVRIEVALSSVIYRERSGAARTSLVLQDVTHTRLVERKLLRLTDLHATRSRCNQIIGQCETAQQLFRAVCQTVVESNAFGLTWIALAERGQVRVAAACAKEGGTEYLHLVRFSLDPDEAAGCGPLGRAIRERRVIVSNDFLNDPTALPWQHEAKQHGYQAAAVFPLDQLGETIGALVLLAPELNYFDEQLVDLLREIAQDISFGLDNLERKAALSTSEARFRTLWETSSDAILMIDQDSVIRYANPAVETLFGHAQAEVIDQPLALLQPVRMRNAHRDGLQRYVQSGKPTINWRGTRVPGLHRDGHEIPLEVVFTEASIGGVRMFTSFMRDVTERKRADDLLASQNLILRMIGSDAELIATLDTVRSMIDEQSADLRCAMQGLPGTEQDACWTGALGLALPPLHQHLFALSGADGLHTAPASVATASGAALLSIDFEQDEGFADCRAAARQHQVRACSVWPVTGRQRQLLATLIVYFRVPRDLTAWERSLLSVALDMAALAIENKRADERIRHLAHFDELTGLPNRARFLQELGMALARGARHNYQVGLLFMDLDRFKNINDTLGHDAGDRVLTEIAERLRSVTRDVDIVARLGGDEFVVVVENVSDASMLSGIAQKLIEQVGRAIDVDAQHFHLSASVGISVYPGDGNDLHALIKNADVAMYRVKDTGRNGYQFYAAQMSAGSLERMRLEGDLRHALERDQLTLYYQPKLDLISGAITGVEALLRWRHPQHGLLDPHRFITLAEETGLIVPLGRWVLQAACRQMKQWSDQGLLCPRVAVNLSARQFRHEQLIDDIDDALRQSGLPADALELEITESLVMDNPERAIALMTRFKALGIRLSMDDFGTGYSSLANLKQYPFDSVKVDRSFVRDLAQDPNDAAISRAIIAMAHALRLRVVAEGVETAAQLDFLRQHGCDEIQGYHFARPMPGDALAAFLRTHQGGGGAVIVSIPAGPAQPISTK